jgi:hypothetical protein
MFGRSAKDEQPTGADSINALPGTKGRPTPSRREAEEARKQQLRSPKGSSKEAKAARRERDQADRQRARQGMLAGDERYLPARDRGPARAMARNFVDGRFTLAEYFIFIAILVLVLGFIPDRGIQTLVSLGFFAITAVIVMDAAVLLFMLSKRARREFPDSKDRKGLMLYAAMRSIQLRRLRLPPPRVRRNGEPIIR